MKILNPNGSINFSEVIGRTKTFGTFLFIGITSLVLYSCSGGEYGDRSYSENLKMADSVSGLISSSASCIGKADSNHSFIRTANIKFKVQDVKTATFRIEDVVAKHNGFVTNTNLQGNISYKNSTKVSEDSLMEAAHYNVDNSLTIRVPNTHLDSVLREIAPLMEFLDQRNIKADDVKFTLLSNQLAETRYKQHKERFTKAIDNKGKKLTETADAENELAFKQENADNTRIETMQLLDQVNYSTITLYIYQPETVKYAMIAGEKTIEPFTPSFATRLGTSFMQGWKLFENLILFFVQIWSILVLMIVMFFSIRKLVIYLSRTEIKKV